MREIGRLEFTTGLLPALLVGLLLAAPARGAEVLLDFEVPEDLTRWRYERQAADVRVRELDRAERFATSGRYALRFRCPAWTPGNPEWPAFEGRPPRADWTEFDRLVLDITNATGAPQQLFLLISDSRVATRDGLRYSATLPPLGYVQAVIPLAGLAEKGVDRADIRVLHFFTERPPADMELYLDRLALLRDGEPAPRVPPSFVRELASIQRGRIEAAREQMREARRELEVAAADAPEAAAWAAAAADRLREEDDVFEARVARADPAFLWEAPSPDGLRERFERLRYLVSRRADFARIRGSVSLGVEPRADVVVGFASSMDKVMPRTGTGPFVVAASHELGLARNERESFQLVVVPYERDVEAVEVRALDLVGPNGARFSAENVEVAVVGYVRTRREPPYGASHVGWWPDPILSFQRSADVARGDAQSFWVRVRAPGSQPAGRYRGRLEVSIDGAPAFSFELVLRVFDFEVPERTPLPLAVTFWPMFYEPDGAGGYHEGEYRDSSWKAHRGEWAEFLAGYYLGDDSLYPYTGRSLDFEILARLDQLGRLGRFNLGYYPPCGSSEAEVAAWRRRTIDVIRPRYETAKRLGLLEHTYIYGCDECPESLFPDVERAARQLKEEFPGALVLTTTYDHSFGLDSVIRSVDGFCPLTPRFDPERAARARAQGKEVWWYICCGPHHPHANMFIEYPAIEARLLMGAMTAKYRPDGFLYYQISIWNSGPIVSGPFTDWDPRSWTTYHGDGAWTCLGPGGTPLPTIRLESFRDGLEDYAYVRVLESRVAEVESSVEPAGERAEWLKRARTLLAVPDSVVRSLVDYTRDPQVLERYRDELAEAIETASR